MGTPLLPSFITLRAEDRIVLLAFGTLEYYLGAPFAFGPCGVAYLV
jgi:hypothetical protein